MSYIIRLFMCFIFLCCLVIIFASFSAFCRSACSTVYFFVAWIIIICACSMTFFAFSSIVVIISSFLSRSFIRCPRMFLAIPISLFASFDLISISSCSSKMVLYVFFSALSSVVSLSTSAALSENDFSAAVF
eukprot:gnl/TRDRNA2_/TRDRNA2_72373_c0_seq1.p1 gnl/TRDRNA2_/TRDRNA2_72373_c0~~gnl/TRDRNA2_/TRDRNA2_72373_c0_seq1.p1  ORF type:complete len:132 (-),score=5.52 gnl/TRDRNA2_/TRDRNA2_72373_c0_seq1:70-465(-)